MSTLLDALKFDEAGLVPAIAQQQSKISITTGGTTIGRRSMWKIDRNPPTSG